MTRTGMTVIQMTANGTFLMHRFVNYYFWGVGYVSRCSKERDH